jgi:maltooligosyltrehalose trehalohydrolase
MTPVAVPGFTPEGDYDLDTGGRLGATVVPGGVRFEVWAPDAERVEVVVDADGRAAAVGMARRAGPDRRASTWTATVPDLGHGSRYRYRLDGGAELADPASRHQPDGVFGPSAAVDPGRWAWTDGGWGGVELTDTVLYELHLGTFTEAGTLDAAIDQLSRLADLGITTVELMPLNQFSGRWGWGYDGVFPLAVQNSYGGPDALARFVEAAHARGLAVVVDVVFNHFGPEGLTADRFGPYTSARSSTPWGPAVNVSEAASDQVRRLFLDSARWWVDDLHADGLRIDAVHAIVDPTARPFLEELNSAVHDLGRRRGRTVLTFLESAGDDARTVTPPPAGVGGDAVWNDDYHHAIRVAITGDSSGYYADYTGVDEVVAVLEDGWVHRGRFSLARGRRHGRRSGGVAPHRFVVADQNHDQIGNRRDGDRLDVLVDLERRKLALAAVLLSPFTPLLFMGEEYGETAPFPFFVDHRDPELMAEVREGRTREFAEFDWPGEGPDPGSEATFRSAVLRPALAAAPPHSWVQELTASLLRLRRSHPAIDDPAASSTVERDGATVILRRHRPGSAVTLALRFADGPGSFDPHGQSVAIDTASSRFGGPGAAVDGASGRGGTVALAPWSAVLAVSDRH